MAEAFYPARTSLLRRTVAGLLETAAQELGPDPIPPKALIVPHAGYTYSGSVAALAYATLAASRHSIERVVIAGPAHRVPFRGLALPGWTAFETPFGQVDVNQAAVRLAQWLAYVTEIPEAHREEHCIEVQLPFLQEVLASFEIVPLVVGDASPTDVAVALNEYWDGPETLVVVTSDLSHYLPYPDALRRDRETITRILDLDPTLEPDRACGATPVNGLLIEARKHGLRPRLLGSVNSGDTGGEKDRVVGYAAIAFE